MKIYLVPSVDHECAAQYEVTDSLFTLVSFGYSELWKNTPKKLHESEVIIDSGAFSFMSKTKKGSGIDWDQYIENYAAALKTLPDPHYIELDIDSVVGLAEVERLRSRLENLMGRPSIPVWHKSRGVEYFKRMVDEYDYIAIGGLVTREITISEYPQMYELVHYARLKGVKVHGLGFTHASRLKRSGFYSVDSSSHSTGARYGKAYIFKNGKLQSYDAPKGKRGIRLNISEHNYREWVKFQHWALDNL